MKKLVSLFCGALLFISHGNALAAGEQFTIKAFAKPATRGNQYSPAPTLDVITTTSFNCNGTTTDKLRIFVGSVGGTQAATGAEQTDENYRFIAFEELINAAKLGYTIENRSNSLQYYSTEATCFIYDFYIYVQ